MRVVIEGVVESRPVSDSGVNLRRAFRRMLREDIHFERPEKGRRRIWEPSKDSLTPCDNDLVIDYICGCANDVLELLALHADARSSTSCTRRRRSCSERTPAKGEVCRNSRARGVSAEIAFATRDRGRTKTRAHSAAHRGSIRPDVSHRRSRLRASSSISSLKRSATTRWYARACSSAAWWPRGRLRGSMRSMSMVSVERRVRSRMTALSGRALPSRRCSATSSRRSSNSASGTSRRPFGVTTVEISLLSIHFLRAGRLTPNRRAASAGRTVSPTRCSRNSRAEAMSSRVCGLPARSARRRLRIASMASFMDGF
jgi:hypothetical protein